MKIKMLKEPIILSGEHPRLNSLLKAICSSCSVHALCREKVNG